METIEWDGCMFLLLEPICLFEYILAETLSGYNFELTTTVFVSMFIVVDSNGGTSMNFPEKEKKHIP